MAPKSGRELRLERTLKSVLIPSVSHWIQEDRVTIHPGDRGSFHRHRVAMISYRKITFLIWREIFTEVHYYPENYKTFKRDY